MKDSYLISDENGRAIYEKVKDLPIYDYHCHLSPKEIYENKPFESLGQLFLGGDHYKWRLMRIFGIPEELVTGSADWKSKFIAYASALEGAAGNPLYHWTTMELDKYFGITEPLCGENAESIFARADTKLAQGKTTPRSLIMDSGVKYIATTDDIADDLAYHTMIAADPTFPVEVRPSFRTDRMLLLEKPDYPDYIHTLEKACGFEICNITDLKKAVTVRLDYFVSKGCKMTDVGIPYFPILSGDTLSAERAFKAALQGEAPAEADYMEFISHMMRYCAMEYAARDLIMQLHLAVKRNANSALYDKLGGDIGCDVTGDPIPVPALITFLDSIEKESPNGLPYTILYSLNPSGMQAMASVAGAFRKVRLGAAWWFCDHKRGIREQLEIIAEYSHLGSFTGMLTDSRSFLSYARHDYFRRILCELLGEWVTGGEYPLTAAEKIARGICSDNIAAILSKGE